MFKKLYPDMYVNSLKDIPLEKLKKMGKKSFILDLDNTVTAWNSNEVDEEIYSWFVNIKKEGFKVCLLSNNVEERVLSVANSLGIPYICRAGKPRRGSFYRALSILESYPDETVVVGDQIFTDILGGNRAGMFTILVVPIARREFIGTKIARSLEYLIVRRLKKYLGDNQEITDI
ncbi:YqeG family HAD IIIA-type phosphatase [Thermosyntropha sp.]|uniref:YqeG family HAD IIIA-type phosphatase n=1 Tax=Thermosyntropha sp. TaxID=2740820 RepID=UPI0025E5C19D|nr:YqeG family HAD IIIA-type phosphatase [Thermosyntropha sp.]MBO8159260.1 YqeG family HAD IIIA-type phosphatase [Thermosyntropha sp.]